ncbi:MAG TPA: hypothetical protein VK810_06270 [Dongiaceae bacterium]|jgi:hypothetical protein|nr:hypothetical protein [Dongiaceae bacterium]
MKTIFKCPGHFWFALALCAMIFSGCSCSTPKPTPDPLAGWQKDYTPDPSDQIIEKDYQDYIQKLPPEERNYVGPVFYFKDGTGQHAVDVQVSLKGKNASWHYAFIYDKENKRIKVIKYGYTRYQS